MFMNQSSFLFAEFSNQPPKLSIPLGVFNLSLGKYREFLIPNTTFFDPEQGFTNNLQLLLYHENGMMVSPEHWIQLNNSDKSLSFFPLLKDTNHSIVTYNLIAQDRQGDTVKDTFSVFLDPSSVENITHEIILQFNEDFALFSKSRNNLFDLMSKVASYFGDPNMKNIVVIRLTYGSTVVSYSNISFSKTVCEHVKIQQLYHLITQNSTGIQPNFAEFLFPKYIIQSVVIKWLGVCKLSVKIPGATFLPTNYFAVLVSVLLPVLCFILILICLLVFFVILHKRKKQRGQFTPNDDKPIFSLNRKPVILANEIDMNTISYKPRRPMVLPGDTNACISNPAFEPLS